MMNGRSGMGFLLPALLLLTLGAAAAGGFWYVKNDAVVFGDPEDLDQVAFGSRVYGRICANCHGTELDGQLGWEKPLKDGTRLAPAHSADGGTWKHADDSLFKVVKFGGESMMADGGVSRMPGFDNKLTDEEIWAVIAFIKSTWPTSVQEQQRDKSTPQTAANE